MNRLPAGVNQSLALIKNVPMPAAFKTENMPALVKNLILGQVAFYGFYNLISGPSHMKLKRYFTVSPDSSLMSLATFHLCHTSALPLAVNLGMLATIGSYVARTRGIGTFTSVFGMGCAAASLAVAMDARSNPNQVQAGSLGASAALLTYTTFRNPAYFSLIRLSPITLVTATLAYGLYNDDKAVIGGIAAGYAAFMLAL